MLLDMYTLTNKQARQFLLRKQGLLGNYKFIGKDGVLSYITQAGCIQFDPVDVCGKNPELVLQSRVKGFQKPFLYDLLYKERKLVDHFDKQLAIFPIGDWKYFYLNRTTYWNERGRDKIEAVRDSIRAHIAENGPACSGDLGLDEKIDWYWSATRLSRAALEYMYFHGELIIHHKKGTNKYYDLIENHLPESLCRAENPFADHYHYLKWNVRRRIGSVGLLWNKPSDAFLGIQSLKAPERNRIYEELLREGEILSVAVDGLSEPFYCSASDEELLNEILAGEKQKERCEFIAPLDNLIWDRKLIKALFHFDYKWEIYTPEAQRKYGYYVLPIIYGDTFAGRIELACDRKAKCLLMKNIWLEEKIRPTKKLETALNGAVKRFARFNDCTAVDRTVQL